MLAKLDAPEVEAIIITALETLNEELDDDEKVDVGPNTALFGVDAEIDSLSLVSVIVDVETELNVEHELDASAHGRPRDEPRDLAVHRRAGAEGLHPGARRGAAGGMSGTYEDKVAVVTGHRRGVGRLVTEHLLDEGATVVGFSRGEPTFEHDRLQHVAVDVSDPTSVAKGFRPIAKEHGRLDLVVNNAAVLTSQYAMIMPAQNARAMVDTNLLGTFLVSREAAKIMRKAKTGRIVNVGSMAASLEPMGDSLYAACKAAISTLAGVLAKEFGTFGVTCNTLAITAIETDMLNQLPREKIDEIIAEPPRAAVRGARRHLQRPGLLRVRPQLVHHGADRVPRGRELITRVVNDEVPANTYVCETSSDGDALVVDPGLSIGRIEEELERRGMRPRWVLLTHGHFDHMGSAALLQQRHGATVTVHKGDRKIAKAANFLMMAAGFEQRIALPEFTVVDGPESEVEISDERGRVPAHARAHARQLLHRVARRAVHRRHRLPGEDRQRRLPGGGPRAAPRVGRRPRGARRRGDADPPRPRRVRDLGRGARGHRRSGMSSSAGILGVGHALPVRVETNEELCRSLPDTTPEWIVEKTGITARRLAGEGETAWSMSVEAARGALEMAGVDPADLGPHRLLHVLRRPHLPAGVRPGGDGAGRQARADVRHPGELHGLRDRHDDGRRPAERRRGDPVRARRRRGAPHALHRPDGRGDRRVLLRRRGRRACSGSSRTARA